GLGFGFRLGFGFGLRFRLWFRLRSRLCFRLGFRFRLGLLLGLWLGFGFGRLGLFGALGWGCFLARFRFLGIGLGHNLVVVLLAESHLHDVPATGHAADGQAHKGHGLDDAQNAPKFG